MKKQVTVRGARRTLASFGRNWPLAHVQVINQHFIKLTKQQGQPTVLHNSRCASLYCVTDGKIHCWLQLCQD